MESLRVQSNEAIEAGAAVFAGLSGDEVDLDHLVAHLTARGFDGGVLVGDEQADGVLWFRDGVPCEAWIFESGDIPELLPNGPGHQRLKALAARGCRISVIVCQPPEAPPEVADWPDAPAQLTDWSKALSPQCEVATEPPAHPWPAILERMAVRIAHSRGPRLASHFVAALNRALERHGGGMDGERVRAPQLPESTWRTIVEAACAPIVTIAGRAFADRTIAASERDLSDVENAATDAVGSA